MNRVEIVPDEVLEVIKQDDVPREYRIYLSSIADPSRLPKDLIVYQGKRGGYYIDARELKNRGMSEEEIEQLRNNEEEEEEERTKKPEGELDREDMILFPDLAPQEEEEEEEEEQREELEPIEVDLPTGRERFETFADLLDYLSKVPKEEREKRIEEITEAMYPYGVETEPETIEVTSFLADIETYTPTISEESVLSFLEQFLFKSKTFTRLEEPLKTENKEYLFSKFKEGMKVSQELASKVYGENIEVYRPLTEEEEGALAIYVATYGEGILEKPIKLGGTLISVYAAEKELEGIERPIIKTTIKPSSVAIGHWFFGGERKKTEEMIVMVPEKGFEFMLKKEDLEELKKRKLFEYAIKLSKMEEEEVTSVYDMYLSLSSIYNPTILRGIGIQNKELFYKFFKKTLNIYKKGRKLVTGMGSIEERRYLAKMFKSVTRIAEKDLLEAVQSKKDVMNPDKYKEILSFATRMRQEIRESKEEAF